MHRSAGMPVGLGPNYWLLFDGPHPGRRKKKWSVVICKKWAHLNAKCYESDACLFVPQGGLGTQDTVHICQSYLKHIFCFFQLLCFDLFTHSRIFNVTDVHNTTMLDKRHTLSTVPWTPHLGGDGHGYQVVLNSNSFPHIHMQHTTLTVTHIQQFRYFWFILRKLQALQIQLVPAE